MLKEFFMQIDVMQIFSASIVLFAIIDILGSTPIILNYQSKGMPVKPLKLTLVSITFMLLFLFGGELVLQLFHVSVEAFAVAGSLVLMIMAIEMVCDVEIFKNNSPESVASIVPIAFPLVAGPGAFVALISLHAEYAMINVLIALAINMLWVFCVLTATKPIQNFLGEGGIYIMRKFFGVILMAISVKLFATNLHVMMSPEPAAQAQAEAAAQQGQEEEVPAAAFE